MQRKSSNVEKYVNMWDVIGPTILVVFFGFCTWKDSSFFSIVMVAVSTAIMIYVVIAHSSAFYNQVKQESIKRKILDKKSKKNPASETQPYQKLGSEFIDKTILLGFDDISVAEACLDFLKKRGIQLYEPYDRLYAALNNPFWAKKTAERIFDFMNKIAPEGSEFREINTNAWGFA